MTVDVAVPPRLTPAQRKVHRERWPATGRGPASEIAAAVQAGCSDEQPVRWPRRVDVPEDAPVFVISVAAELAGMHAQTLRQYDRLGLVRRAGPGGGRRYTPRDVALLREVQRLSQEDGVNLAGIKRIIELESRVEALRPGCTSSRGAGRREPTDRSRGRHTLRRLPAATWCRTAGRATALGGLAAPERSMSGRPPPPRPSSGLEREIGLLLRRSRAISARLARELHADLDGAAYGLLALLEDTGPLRASELVTRLGLDKSTVSRQVASLVELGLVDRAADPDDGRAQVLTSRRRARPVWRGSGRCAGPAGSPTSGTGRPSDVAGLGELLGRLNRIGEARKAEVAGAREPAGRGRWGGDTPRDRAERCRPQPTTYMVAVCKYSAGEQDSPCPSPLRPGTGSPSSVCATASAPVGT